MQNSYLASYSEAVLVILLIFEKDRELGPAKGNRQTKDPPFFGVPWTKWDQAGWNAYRISGEIYPWAINLSEWRPTIYQAYSRRPLNWWTVGIETPSASISAIYNLHCATTYSVSVTNHIPRKARRMPTWALWSWNRICTSHPHGKQKSRYNPKLKRGGWWMEGARALPQQMKSQWHAWTDAEVCHRSVCKPWGQSSAIWQRENLEQRERAKEGEQFPKHFWSYYWLYEYC